MLKKIGYQLLGTLVLRGGFFIAFLLAIQLFSAQEIASFGLMLLISNSFSTCIAMSFGVECRNNIVEQGSIAFLNIKYFISALIATSFFSYLLYSYLDTLKIISVENYLINFLLINVLIYLQQIIYGYELIKENSKINLVVGVGWLTLILLFFPKEINCFVMFYNLMILFQILFIIFILFRKISVKAGLVSFDFIGNYIVYAAFGLPVFMVAQLIIERYASVEVLAKIVVLTQITNLIGFFNTQIIAILYNKLIKVNSLIGLNSVVNNFKMLNYLFICGLFFSFFFKDYIESYLKQEWIGFFVNMMVFCLTSYYWVYNEFLLAKRKAKFVRECNIIFGLVFILLLVLFYVIVKSVDIYMYIFSLLIARMLAIFLAKKAIRIYFYENING